MVKRVLILGILVLFWVLGYSQENAIGVESSVLQSPAAVEETSQSRRSGASNSPVGATSLAPSTPFNVGEIIEKVSHHPVKEGERIVIKDRAYEACFDESGVILKGRETKVPSEDLVIPVSGKPEIRDGRVVYPTPCGEIIFEGTSRGLRYEETGHSSVFTSPINKYTGNIARFYPCHSEASPKAGRRISKEEIPRFTRDVASHRIATLPSVARNDNYSEFSTSGEFLLDTNVVYVAAPYYQEYASLAYDGTNYLVVWRDTRAWLGYGDIYGARVSRSGVILDSAGVVVCGAYHEQWFPVVVFGGTDYLVAWQDRRNRSGDDVYCTRVTRSGSVLDPQGIAVSTANNNQSRPAVASGGSDFLVAWTDQRGNAEDIYGARITQAGVVLDPNGLVVSAAANSQSDVAIAFDGVNYFVVWCDGRSGTSPDIYGTRVSRDGVVIDPSGMIVSNADNAQSMPALAFDGSRYFVVWHDCRTSPGYNDVYGARITTAGVVLDSQGIVVSKSSNLKSHVSVAAGIENYLTAWNEQRGGREDILGARISFDGVVLDTTGIVISGANDFQLYPWVAFDGNQYLVVWQDRRFGEDDIYGARVSVDGVVLEPDGIRVSICGHGQYMPAVAFDGNNYLVTWADTRDNNDWDVYGARVTPLGAILDPPGFAVSDTVDFQGMPVVAFDGSNYLVVWIDGRNQNGTGDIYGARVSPSGIVLDLAGFPISTERNNQNWPSVCFDGTNYLAVWQDHRYSSSYSDVFGARITRSGMVLDTAGIAISTAASHQSRPTVVHGSNNCLVVWYDYRYEVDIYGSRISSSGAVLDPSGVCICGTTNTQYMPSAAFDGSNYFVVWHDSRNMPGDEADIYGARVSQAGGVLDPLGIAISTAPGQQVFPTIAFDGSANVIAWEDYRSGLSSDIFGAKVSTNGVLTDTFAISCQPMCQTFPRLARGQGSQLLVAYSGFIDSIGHRPANTMRIWGKFLGPVGVEEARSQQLEARNALQIYPNPFRRQTQIKLSVGQSAKSIALKIYDASGRLVRQWDDKTIRLSDQIAWDGLDQDGHKLPAGVYFCRLERSDYSVTEKIVKLK